MVKKKVLLVLYLLIISLVLHATDYTNDADVKKIRTTVELSETFSADVPVIININSAESFKQVKKNDIVALLISNNEYPEDADIQPLKQCINDTALFSRILSFCCKVPDENIHVKNNITAEQFKQSVRSTIKTLRNNQGFLLYYSGHGDRDGSLIFSDGNRITPQELQALINSFMNDTVMILDACYSGKNEDLITFRNNCTRIYSSLAPFVSKEITYINTYFTPIKTFYEDVLGLKGPDELQGNGYFTAFIGYFFAENNFNDTDNITYWDLISYVSNKSKQYIEYLAEQGNKSGSYSEEIGQRINQQPKIAPMISNKKQLDINHRNIVIKKPDKPIGLVPEIMTGPFLSFGILDGPNEGLFSNKVTPHASIRLIYNSHYLKGFMFGMEAGYLFAYRNRHDYRDAGTAGNKFEVDLHMVPVLGLIGYRYQFAGLKNILSIRAEAGAGISFNIRQTRNFTEGNNTKYGDLKSNATFCFQGGTGFSIHPIKHLAISLDVQVYGVLLSAEDLLLGIKFPISVSYKL